ncbi:molybdopterin-dependent oxidoreductase [Goekera deserti]|uniref:molybdopterin-dependent oxidoreductase n=1 Tax=Goekera deserti TaxID=2497753 RepID=UPI00192EAEA1|nr:molybdopterin-dependent oxidoreductase [Goekera deserti]
MPASTADLQLPDDVRSGGGRRWPAPLAGVVASAAGLGAAELVGGLVDRAPSLVTAVGDTVVDHVPLWLERAAISLFGTHDKQVLLAGVLLVALALGAGLGVLAQRRPALGAAGFAVAGALAAWAALGDPRRSAPWTLAVAVLAVVVGVAVLRALLGRAALLAVPASTAGQELARRSFLVAAGGTAALAVLAGVGGWLLSGRDRVEQLREAIRLPRPAQPAAAPGTGLDVPGLSPLYTPNDSFYRIDTALRVPGVDTADWSLRVTGMVDRPFSLSYADLMAMPQVEADVTLSCVSNEVGGDLVGTARWQGVRLRTLLDRAGVQAGAEQVLGRSVDGFTAGFPVQVALDVENALVAVGMNGQPLPIDHGFPARLVVPGLYGYVSATKWLTEIELTTWGVQGYWVPRGWSREGPVKTQSRIDVPRAGSSVPAGRQAVAGVAWAPTRGVQRVQVQVDDGPWTDARLAPSIGDDCWRQWSLAWDATPGEHRITVRATDGTGEVQTDRRTQVAPDGASGYPVVEVTVDG